MDVDLWMYEKEARNNGFSVVAGVDEAGRGPLAGPVVSAAVILPSSFKANGLTDSKKLSAARRTFYYNQIYSDAYAIGIGIIDPLEIDRINILQASLLAMFFAVTNLNPTPDFLLIDGQYKIRGDCHQKTIIKGDALSISIAAASVIAKVTRDRLMEKYHIEYPDYQFQNHKGYPTKAHREAIRDFGCCPIHRRSFKGVKESLS
jgi:ribonuclease HII